MKYKNGLFKYVKEENIRERKWQMQSVVGVREKTMRPVWLKERGKNSKK